MVGGDIEGVLPTIHHAYAHMCVHVERREGLVVMTNFIVASQAKVDDVTQRLSETVFGSPEGFILAYNQHLLNAKNATVAAFAHDITAAYKNVESANRRITIIPDDEVYFNEIISRATLWKDFVTVRRMVAGVAKKVIQRGANPDDLYVEAINGFIHVKSTTDPDMDVRAMGKVPASSIRGFFQHISSMNPVEEDGPDARVTYHDVMDVDTSFAGSVNDGMPDISNDVYPFVPVAAYHDEEYAESTDDESSTYGEEDEQDASDDNESHDDIPASDTGSTWG